jgi:acyl-CoA synthetase (AMP-forming)/AMP-acid ligase II
MRPRPDDTAFLFYSSGSTGKPKGVMLGQSAQWHTGLAVGYEVGIAARDRGLVVMPLFHIGARFFQLAHHMAGAAVHLMRRFDAAAAVAAIERERITTLHLAPTMIRAALDLPDLERYDLSSLRTLSYGAAAMPVALLRRALDRFGPILMQRYGSTESAAVSYLDKHHHKPDGTAAEMARLASAGQPGVMAELRVVRADGSDCDIGEAGVVMVRNPKLVMQGYWRNPDATRAVLRDGWYDMGDIGYFDAEGFLFIVDRKTEMIISGGENIYPREVEEAILHHPAVADTAVIGIPDDRWGEAVLAFVVLRDGATADEPEIIEFCRTRIASYKKPRRIEFRDSLPRASTGKIDKIRLREPYWQGRDRRV